MLFESADEVLLGNTRTVENITLAHDVEDLPDLLAESLLLDDAVKVIGVQLFKIVLHVQENVLFPREIVMQRRFGDLRLFADHRDRRLVEPIIIEEVDRRIDNSCTCIVLIAFRGFAFSHL